MNGMETVKASAYETPSIQVESFDVQAIIRADRTVEVTEKFTIKFLKNQTMFYRMLDKQGARYFDIQATCPENSDFYFYVADNPDYSDFLDINCVGGAEKGNVWTYNIHYIMEENLRSAWDTFSIDVVGYGGPVEMHNVSVEVQFPDKPLSLITYLGDQEVGVGQANLSYVDNAHVSLSDDGKTLYMRADCLKLQYNAKYGERMAAGFTVECEFQDGVLASIASVRYFTRNLVWLILVGVVCVVLAIFIKMKTSKKHELVTVVNVTAPDEMDPMRMGKWLDGVVDNEDVTSMMYYFAEKGYLEIDFSDEDDPVFLKKRNLPADAPAYMKTLFNGLFKRGDEVCVSSLSEKYYASVEIAKNQLPTPTMYEPKSILGFLAGGILGGLFAALVPMIMSTKIGGGYVYWAGFVAFLPIVAILIIAYIRENYRYKWKASLYKATFIGMIILAVVAMLIFSFVLAPHIMTIGEILVMDAFAFLATIMGVGALSRKESYLKELGDILGFKDFILYTEEDKIKFMLEENPQLYYKVLPYAQVLGVTNEWEEKFAKILIPAPTWCTSPHMDVFDYIILNRCMRRAMATAMRPPQNSTGGRSGSGGGFSGGGGGFGGGGFGSR